MRRSWALLRSLGLEFWLPLPIVGLLFWAVSGWISDRQLRSSIDKPESVQFNPLPKKQYAGIITAITIKTGSQSTTVIVNTTSPTLQTFTLKIPTANREQVELVIAQTLGLSIAEVRALSQPAQ